MITHKKIQKFIAIVAATLLLTGQLAPIARAFEVPTAPSAPTPPPEPTSPPQPSQDAPTPPTAPDAPTYGDNSNNEEENNSHDNGSEESQEQSNNDEETQPSEQQAENTQNSTNNEGDGNDTSGTVGDTEIETGDATANADSSVSVNTNESSGVNGESGPSVQIANTGNGSDSTNTGSASIANTNNTIQNNSAYVASGIGLSANTGKNDASKNVGNTTIETGDANVSGTMISAVNTNVEGMMVSEFNVVDDHVGDIVLDFAANCVSGCATGNTTLANVGNGSGSDNTTNLDVINTDETFQTNDAIVENNMILYADSGNNDANKNTGGDSTIMTGDANIAANLVTFANNNIAGDVIYGIVNIYGNLYGDIILPEDQIANCCGTDTHLSNTGNGTDSTNIINADIATIDSDYQTNFATIDNNLIFDSTTGNNDVSKNTGGDNSVTTGDSSLMANVLNVANTNMNGGVWWLVLVNEAGQWLGKILGSEDGANYAGSQGSEFTVNEFGEVTVTNSGNGAESTNTTNLSQTTTDTNVQTNTASVVNNVKLDANTGGNSTSKNTGGNNTIETGDSNVIANIVNFVNNNMIGQGKLLVTVVNVFGSWLGDFVAPGTTKATNEHTENNTSAQSGVGGANVGSQNTSQSQTTNTTTQNSGGTTISTTPTGKVTLAYGGVNSTYQSEADPTVLAATVENPINEVEAVVAGRKVVQINLAWLLFIIPCAIMLVAVRRMRNNRISRSS